MNWEEMWAAGLKPGDAFDIGKASKCLMEVLPMLKGSSALVPGAGRAYDAIALAEAGFDVTALDISRTACQAAQALIGGNAKVRICEGDFFAHEGTYDVIWDCTFLCALPPQMRQQWAAQSAKLVAPSGSLVTMVFPIGKGPGGPPFALSIGIVSDLLEPLGFKASTTLDLPKGTHMPGAPFGNAVVIWKREG